jgi:hypothetical protein
MRRQGMFKLIGNQKGEAIMGTFLVLLFLMFVAGEVTKDGKDKTPAPNTVNQETRK